MSVHFLLGKMTQGDPWQEDGITYQDMPPETETLVEVVSELQKKKMVIWVGVAKKDGRTIGLMAHIMGYKSVLSGEIDFHRGDRTNSNIQSFYEEHGRWPRTEKNLIKMTANPMSVDEDRRAFEGLVKELGKDIINLQNLGQAVAVLPPILKSYDS